MTWSTKIHDVISVLFLQKMASFDFCVWQFYAFLLFLIIYLFSTIYHIPESPSPDRWRVILIGRFSLIKPPVLPGEIKTLVNKKPQV